MIHPDHSTQMAGEHKDKIKLFLFDDADHNNIIEYIDMTHVMTQVMNIINEIEPNKK